MAKVAIVLTNLSGFGTEDAFFLQYSYGITIDARGLLLGAILIGAMGVLDDITTAQAAVVDELQKTNQKLSRWQLFTKAMSVGREHITSLVNTLFLAYAGGSLATLILYYLNQTKGFGYPAWFIFNSDIITEEIVRTLAGSIALVLAVPLTSFLAAWLYTSRWRHWVGDSGAWGTLHHGHNH